MQAIDVVMLTKNSEHLLEKCLASIYTNVPVNSFIVVDGFSTDRTLKILDAANEKHGNIKILSSNGSRAKARERGIAKVETDWFLFVDSDVVLSRGWFQKAQRSIRDGVGAVWGVNIDVIPNLSSNGLLRLQTLVATKSFHLRGGTHDTLLRRDLVQDIEIPEKLHTHEDAYLLNWIKNKGYHAVVGEDIFCLHYKPPENWSMKNAFDGALQEFQCGVLYSKNYRYIMYYPFFTLYWLLQSMQNLKRLLPT